MKIRNFIKENGAPVIYLQEGNQNIIAELTNGDIYFSKGLIGEVGYIEVPEGDDIQGHVNALLEVMANDNSQIGDLEKKKVFAHLMIDQYNAFPESVDPLVDEAIELITN